jgi:PhoPQ-activated pathogenicity-related protein
MSYLNTPGFQKMAQIIDPQVYIDTLAKIPKYLIVASGDEFFIPDATREFWQQVPG